MPKPMSRSVNVRLGKQDSSSSSFFVKMFLKSIYNLNMSLKEQMLQFFEQPEVHQRILDYADRMQLSLDDLEDEETMMRMVEDLQLLGEIESRVREEQTVHQPLSNITHTLSLSISKGRKFKPLMDLPRPAHFFFSLAGFGQKVKSSRYDAAENFSLLERLSVSLKTGQLRGDNHQNLQLTVMVVSGGKKILYSIKLIEWRFVLVYGSLNLDIQLAPYHHDGLTTLPSAGILSITLALNPLPKHLFLSEPSLTRQLDLQQKLKESANNKFHTYANSYWSEIKSVHRSLQTRRIPIYAQTEDKIYYPLPKLVKPLHGVRGIDSPHHALRFCSLIPFSEDQPHREKSLKRFTSMLNAQEGSVEDHCHLLCSLLLGMGQKAFVCVGTISKGEHSWVMSQSASSLTFWECTKGIKVDYFSPKALTYYKTINAVYNNKEYYANLQLDDSVSGTKFNFKDGTLWKRMDEAVLQEMGEFNKSLSLAYPSINPYQTEQNIEAALGGLISDYRARMKLPYNSDEVLASFLSTALANYQIQRVTGSTFCEEQFQFAIKNYIPAKHTFKAFPVQLTTLDPQEILEHLLEQPKAKEILQTKGESLYFAVRTKLVVFPDNISALWLSLAVRYYRLD